MPPDPDGPTADLDTTAKALYRKLRKFLEDAGRWESSDRYILAKTCAYEQRSRLARESLPLDPKGKPILTTGGRSEFSGEVAHPLVRIMEAADKSFVEGLRDLGLTPRARAQLGLKRPASKGGGGIGGAFES